MLKAVVQMVVESKEAEKDADAQKCGEMEERKAETGKEKSDVEGHVVKSTAEPSKQKLEENETNLVPIKIKEETRDFVVRDDFLSKLWDGVISNTGLFFILKTSS